MFQYYPVETPADRFGAFAAVVGLWRACGQGRGLPGWRDFTLSDFMGWHASMALSEATAGRNDIRFRYFGSEMVYLQARDLTGGCFSDLLPMAYDGFYRPHIVHMLDMPLIALGAVPSASDRGTPGAVTVLHLPLADDGHHIDRFLHFCLQGRAEADGLIAAMAS